MGTCGALRQRRCKSTGRELPSRPVPADLNQTVYAADYRRLLVEAGVGHLAERLLRAAQLGLHIEKLGERVCQPRPRLFGFFPRAPRMVLQPAPSTPGSSRIGGLPDVPANFAWPMHAGRPAQFLLQLRCADLAAYADHTLLPRDGMLWFFLESTRGSVFHPFVIHRRDLDDLRQLTLPTAGNRPPKALRAYPLRFVPLPTLPPFGSPEWDALDLHDEFDPHTYESELDRFAKFEERWDALAKLDVRHQIGGHAAPVQDDVRPNLHLAACGQPYSRNADAWRAAELAAPHWRLLLQFDSDGDLDLMWGDAGRVYFGMHADDLRAERFDRAAVTWDCG